MENHSSHLISTIEEAPKKEGMIEGVRRFFEISASGRQKHLVSVSWVSKISIIGFKFSSMSDSESGYLFLPYRRLAVSTRLVL